MRAGKSNKGQRSPSPPPAPPAPQAPGRVSGKLSQAQIDKLKSRGGVNMSAPKQQVGSLTLTSTFFVMVFSFDENPFYNSWTWVQAIKI